MKAEEAKIGEKYRSNANPIAHDCRYEIINKFKTVCWVRLWENNGTLPTETIYKGIPYKILVK